MNRVQLMKERDNDSYHDNKNSAQNTLENNINFTRPPTSIYSGFTSRPNLYSGKESNTTAPTPKFDVSPMYAEIKLLLKEKNPASASKNPKVDMKKVKEFMDEKSSTGLLKDKLPPPTPKTAHKRYHPVLPCASKLLAKKWDDETWRKHKEKVKTMKACIDNVHTTRLSTSGALKANANKQEIEKKISKENQILVDRMARTFAHPSVFTNFDEAYEKTTRDLEHKSKAYMRKRDIVKEKIDKENKILLERVKTKRPIYEAKKWDQEQEEHLRYLMIMTSFPEAYQKNMDKAETASSKSTKSKHSNALSTKPKKDKKHIRSKEQVPLPDKLLVEGVESASDFEDVTGTEPVVVLDLNDMQNCSIQEFEEEASYPSHKNSPVVVPTTTFENKESKHEANDESYESDFNTTTSKGENSIISSIFITKAPASEERKGADNYLNDAFEFFD
ncbi:hypothetical protein HDV01_002555 [Terramyces sp. JEL0728]|nr:hypothetical protein HDV01_002555 [Terramyces sp. JEL0728]